MKLNDVLCIYYSRTGNTKKAMQSAAFDTFMEDLCDIQGVPLRACFEKSFCLSADVTAAFDPNFADVFEKRNAAILNYGIGLCKYTGARGKSGASDADAETVAYVRNLFDAADVIWQISELGKVDAGGGGTVAMAGLPQEHLRLIQAYPGELKDLSLCTDAILLEDFRGRYLVAFGGAWSVGYLLKHNPGLELQESLSV